MSLHFTYGAHNANIVSSNLTCNVLIKILFRNKCHHNYFDL